MTATTKYKGIAITKRGKHGNYTAQMYGLPVVASSLQEMKDSINAIDAANSRKETK